MATIKSYTDIEQSKKLAEILSLESADMHYCLEKRDVAIGYEIGIVPFIQVRKFKGKCNIVDVQPVWSLAVLLSILPEIQGDKPIIALYDNYITYPLISGLHTKADNLIDACYEMILKLHELKML